MYNSKKRIQPAREYQKKVNEAVNRSLLKSYNSKLKFVYDVKKEKG